MIALRAQRVVQPSPWPSVVRGLPAVLSFLVPPSRAARFHAPLWRLSLQNIGRPTAAVARTGKMPLRSCSCAFCRSHGTRTVSDRDGAAEITASDWSLVERYRFGSRTADYLLCRRCGVYVGAVCETGAGPARGGQRELPGRSRGVQQTPAAPDYDGEATESVWSAAPPTGCR